jgi:hypothetical protein
MNEFSYYAALKSHAKFFRHFILAVLRFGKKSAQFLRYRLRLAASIGIP